MQSEAVKAFEKFNDSEESDFLEDDNESFYSVAEKVWQIAWKAAQSPASAAEFVTLALMTFTGRGEPVNILPIPDNDTEALYAAVKSVMFIGDDFSERHKAEIAEVVAALQHDGEHHFEDAHLELRTVQVWPNNGLKIKPESE